MNALYNLRKGEPVRNDSKGCGGVMRVAPLGLAYPDQPIEMVATEAEQLSKITHQHPLGYMTSAMLADLIHRIVFLRGKRSLVELTLESRQAMVKLYQENPFLEEMLRLVDLAVELAENDHPDLENIHRLGEGWVAEETLGIALYCSLRHQDDFSAGLIASVNHSGDSDSTGAVTGNILGAWLGIGCIGEQWRTDLELEDVIIELADDLCSCCLTSRKQLDQDEDWSRKYIQGSWKKRVESQASVLFWHEYDAYGEFSNWYPAPFMIDGQTYETVEQYMMAKKAKFFHDEKTYAAIMQTASPRECKMLGRQVTPFDAAAWDAVSDEIVGEALQAKFEQNPDLMELLLSTEGRVLAEASPVDLIWGIGLDAEDAA